MRELGADALPPRGKRGARRGNVGPRANLGAERLTEMRRHRAELAKSCGAVAELPRAQPRFIFRAPGFPHVSLERQSLMLRGPHGELSGREPLLHSLRRRSAACRQKAGDCGAPTNRALAIREHRRTSQIDLEVRTA